jgi:hypothetical protein
MNVIEWIIWISYQLPWLMWTCFALLVLMLFPAFAWPMREASSPAAKSAVFFKTLLIIMFPMTLFLLSTILQPPAKNECKLGWFDCWQGGKLVLLPLVLWAIAALYRHELFQKRATIPKWILYGLTWGSLISGASLFHGVLLFLLQADFHMVSPVELINFLAPGLAAVISVFIPASIFAWFTYRAVQAWRNVAVPGVHEIFWNVLGGGTLWVGSVAVAQKLYNDLPATTGCFIVTSASRGHIAIVGLPSQVLIGGLPRIANRQLQHFWQFEALWMKIHPSSHRQFCCIYNSIGPKIAEHIKNPWIADVVFLALKPFEVCVTCCVWIAHNLKLPNCFIK